MIPARDEISTAHASSVVLRLWCLLALFATATLIFLGAIWPSIFTLFALLVLPAPFLALVAVVKPGFVRRRRWLRIYLITGSALAAVSWVWELCWLLMHRS